MDGPYSEEKKLEYCLAGAMNAAIASFQRAVSLVPNRHPFPEVGRPTQKCKLPFTFGIAFSKQSSLMFQFCYIIDMIHGGS